MAVSLITDHIYIGDVEDAKGWEGPLLCVLENLPDIEPNHAIWIPIIKNRLEKVMMKDKDGKDTDYMTHEYVDHAIPQQLDLVSSIMDIILESGEDLLVHCGAGQERSPLAVTYYLHKKWNIPLEDAFAKVKEKRPEALNRLYWLNKEEDHGKV